MKLLSSSQFVRPLSALSMSALLLHSAAAAPAKPVAKAPVPRRVLTTEASVRVLHAIPGGPNVVVSLDGRKAFGDVAFKTLSAYQKVTAGAHRIVLNAVGQTTPLAEAQVTLNRGSSYTLVAVAAAGRPTLQVENESTGRIPAGRAQLRVYHYAPGAGTVSITAPGAGKGGSDYVSVIPRLQPKKVEVRSFKPGTYTLQVRTTSGQLLKQLPAIVLAEGTRTSAFAVGKAADGSFDVLITAENRR